MRTSTTRTPSTSQTTHSKPFRWRRKEKMFHHQLAYVILSLSIGSAAASSTEIPSQSTAAQSNSVISFSPASSIASATSVATSATATTKTKYKTMYACEDRQLTMDCETGSKINLIRANFGRFSITQCNEQGTLDLATDCMSRFTFRIMQERCQDKQRCSVNATSAIFGDRCPTTRKYLEVHFQCLQASEYTDKIDLRANPPLDPIQAPVVNLNPIGPTRPPNNVPPTIKHSDDNYNNPTILPETTKQVINSQVMTPAMALNLFEISNKLESELSAREPIMVSLRHLGTENVSRPRCYQWDKTSNQWTDRGTRIIETNQTHTICAFDQQTSYVLVMDYSGPTHPISPSKPEVIPPSYVDPSSQFLPNLLENQPIPLPSYPPMTPIYPPSMNDETSGMIRPPMPNRQQQSDQQQSSSARTFFYLISIVVVAVALLALTLVASSMRSTAEAALKSLGSFTPFNGPKYKHKHQDGIDAPSLHSNKDLLVINNSNGHSFIYAPASTTKISSSSSTHILSSGVQQPSGLNNHQAGTLHRLQQQQMYSGNGATLSSLSGTGAQSNNYYYGLMGLNPLLQQQQQQQNHFSQHHLNQQQPQQAQFAGQQHQVSTAASYNHQANKSSVSTESANSSASSSGVESGSTSMQQQQRARTQQACLVSAMNNNDFHLMGHHISNYGQHQPQQHNLFATLKGANVTHHQQQHHQPTFTVNAHYSTSGVASGVQSINAAANQTTTTTGATGVMLHNRQVSNQMRDHIYECVDDDKPYMARLLMPTHSNSQHQIFGSPSFMSTRRTAANDCTGRQK